MDKPKGPEAIAKAKMAEIEAAKTAAASAEAAKSKNPESQEPEADPSPAEKTPVDSPEAKAALEQAEAQAAADKVILETPEDKLDADQKARKVELAKLQKEPPKPKTGAEKRIAELVGEVKSLKAQVGNASTEDKKRILTLEAQIKELQDKVTKPVEAKKEADESKKREEARLAKYLSEDQELPREERREMPKDELEAWFIEDPTEAQAWITERTLRRDRERREEAATLKNKDKAAEIIKAQGISQAKVTTKHPDMDFRTRLAALKAEGKTREEAQAILSKENPTGFEKARICAEIIKEDEDTYLMAPNGPELLMEEMERRLEKGKKKTPAETEAERDQRIAEEAAEAERQRQDGIDDPLNSKQRPPAPGKETEAYKKGLDLFLKAMKGKKNADGKTYTKADYDKRLQARSAIPGAA